MYFWQLLGSVVYTIILLGFNGLYATLVCVACCQLEKLRANLLDIRQKLDTPVQDSGAETDREEEGQVEASQEVFCRMQKQLNDCIRHHHEILRCTLLSLKKYWSILVLQQYQKTVQHLLKIRRYGYLVLVSVTFERWRKRWIQSWR
jgi:hypothetical protein